VGGLVAKETERRKRITWATYVEETLLKLTHSKEFLFRKKIQRDHKGRREERKRCGEKTAGIAVSSGLQGKNRSV